MKSSNTMRVAPCAITNHKSVDRAYLIHTLDAAGRSVCHSVFVCITVGLMAELFDLDQLDDNDPFEIDRQAAHLFKHAGLGIDDIQDVWQSDPLFRR